MYDKILVITIKSNYSKVPSTGTAEVFSYRTGNSVLFYKGTKYWYRGTFKKYRANHCILRLIK